MKTFPPNTNHYTSIDSTHKVSLMDLEQFSLLDCTIIDMTVCLECLKKSLLMAILLRKMEVINHKKGTRFHLIRITLRRLNRGIRLSINLSRLTLK